MMTTPSGTLFVIPAKANSTRVPGKNLRLLGGQPLVRWTIEAAMNAKQPDDRVVVSTDSPTIAEIAAAAGATASERPAELAHDPAQAPEVVMHVLSEDATLHHGMPAAVVMLLPTSPFRSGAQIRAALSIHRERHRSTLVSVTECAADLNHRLLWMSGTRIQHGPPLRTPWVHDGTFTMLNGAIWIATPAELHLHRHFSAIDAVPFLMDPETGLDIDSDLDFAVAEAIVARRYETITRCVS